MLKTEHLVNILTHDYFDYQCNHIHDSLENEKEIISYESLSTHQQRMYKSKKYFVVISLFDKYHMYHIVLEYISMKKFEMLMRQMY